MIDRWSQLVEEVIWMAQRTNHAEPFKQLEVLGSNSLDQYGDVTFFERSDKFGEGMCARSIDQLQLSVRNAKKDATAMPMPTAIMRSKLTVMIAVITNTTASDLVDRSTCLMMEGETMRAAVTISTPRECGLRVCRRRGSSRDRPPLAALPNVRSPTPSCDPQIADSPRYVRWRR